jgi:hypothetical protein
MVMASTITTTVSFSLPRLPSLRDVLLVILQYPSLPSQPPPCHSPLAIAAFKKLSEAQPLVDEDALPPKPGVYGVYDPTGGLQLVGISHNIRATSGYDAYYKCTFQMFKTF